MPLIFELYSTPKLPLDVRRLVPEQLENRSVEAIGEMEIGDGNQTGKVSDYFRISGKADDQHLIFRGYLQGVHFLGSGMSRGRIEVDGSAGRHVGDSMSGGEMIVLGNTSDYTGFEMTGGTIVVHGCVGDHTGGCYPGASFGMNRGTILIAGNAGKGLGYRMRRGTIVVGGNVDAHAGWQMRAGTIMVFGNAADPVGVDMKRGTIAIGISNDSSQLNDLGQTFHEGQTSHVPILAMLMRWLTGQASRYEIDFPDASAPIAKCWHGDQLAGGRGEVFAMKP